MNLTYLFRNSWWVKRKRPKTKIGFTVFDLIIEIVGLVAVLSMWILVMVYYSQLPDLNLPVVATILYAGMTLLSRFPRIFNYPVSITENNASFQYRNMARMIRCLKLSLVLVFGFGVLQTIQNVEDFGIWYMPLTFTIITLPVIYFMVKSFMNR